MIAYKAFNEKDGVLSCRGKVFDLNGWNEEKKAGCAACGFHAAENPLDCLSYYSDMKRSVYCIVECQGDVDEDACDSKIACTRMKILCRMDLRRFVSESMKYIYRHPQRKRNARVNKGTGEARDGFCIVEGEEPKAKGKAGDLLGYVIKRGEKVTGCYLAEVDGKILKENRYYTVSEIQKME